MIYSKTIIDGNWEQEYDVINVKVCNNVNEDGKLTVLGEHITFLSAPSCVDRDFFIIDNDISLTIECLERNVVEQLCNYINIDTDEIKKGIYDKLIKFVSAKIPAIIRVEATFDREDLKVFYSMTQEVDDDFLEEIENGSFPLSSLYEK